MITAGSNYAKKAKKEYREEFGLIPKHSYTVLGVYEISVVSEETKEEGSIRLIKLRNP